MKLSIQNDAEVLTNKEKNRKIITMYRILSYDLIFYYTISYLFLVNVKLSIESKINNLYLKSKNVITKILINTKKKTCLAKSS